MNTAFGFDTPQFLWVLCLSTKERRCGSRVFVISTEMISANFLGTLQLFSRPVEEYNNLCMCQSTLLKLHHSYACNCYTKGTVTNNLLHHNSCLDTKHRTGYFGSIFNFLAIKQSCLYLFPVRVDVMGINRSGFSSLLYTSIISYMFCRMYLSTQKV